MNRLSQTKAIQVTTTTAEIVARAVNRVALTIGPPLSDSVTLYPASSGTITSGQGFNLLPNGGPLTITRETHGDLVQSAWRAVSATASVYVGVAEIFEV